MISKKDNSIGDITFIDSPVQGSVIVYMDSNPNKSPWSKLISWIKQLFSN